MQDSQVRLWDKKIESTMKVVFVIKGLQQGVWLYYTDHDVRLWDEDLYVAKHFDTYPRAEQYLLSQTTWGGHFQIEKVFINGR